MESLQFYFKRNSQFRIEAQVFLIPKSVRDLWTYRKLPSSNKTAGVWTGAPRPREPGLVGRAPQSVWFSGSDARI